MRRSRVPPREESAIDRLKPYVKRYRWRIVGGLALVVATMFASFQIPPLTRKAVDALALSFEASELAELRWWSYVFGTPPALGEAGLEAVAQGAGFERVARYALLICAIALMGAFLRVNSRTLLFNAGRHVERDLRADYYRRLQTLDPPFFERRTVGDLMSRATNDLGNVRLLLGPGILSVANFAVAYALALTMMSRISVELLVYSLLPFPLVMLLVRGYSARLYEHSKSVQEGLSDLVTKVEENLQGIGVLKSYALEDTERAAFERLNDDYYERSRKLVISRGLMFPLMGSLGSIGLFVVIWVGGSKVIRGEMTLGQFVEFSQYLAALAWPTAAMGWVLGLFQRGVASLKRIDEIFEEEPVIRDLGSESPEPVEGRIELRGLTFRYEGEKAFGLEDL
ncbi:MAG: hypothetical protein K8I02_05920, partial [Candidatus Methylomirabilis sp.]|nr:hypothetical protein [Deltaproteobacteria bacterium]